MIRYELKDKEKQAALEKILPEFGADLQAACDEQFDDEFNHVCVRLSDNGGVFCDDEVNIKVNIKKTAIRVKNTYDPHSWNKYPKVTPPEGVWMRVETWNACGAVIRGVFMYVNGAWRRSAYADPQNEIKAARFRPWDEGDEE